MPFDTCWLLFVVVSWLLCVGCLLLLFVLVVDRCLLLVGVAGSIRSLLTLFDGWCLLFAYVFV